MKICKVFVSHTELYTCNYRCLTNIYNKHLRYTFVNYLGTTGFSKDLSQVFPIALKTYVKFFTNLSTHLANIDENGQLFCKCKQFYL